MSSNFEFDTDKLRQTVHEALDNAIGAVAGALNSVGGSMAGGGVTSGLESYALHRVPPPAPAAGGADHQTRVSLENHNEESTEPFELKAADLVSSAGDRIPASAIAVDPAQRVVAGNSHDTVAVTVKVPADAKPGDYTGEIEATNGAIGPVPLTVHVA
jgi:hypothetical protein